MRPIKQYICVVDYGTPPRFRQKTAGRYQVGAKDAKEAVKLCRAAIKFGSVMCIGEAKEPASILSYKQVFKYNYGPDTKLVSFESVT